MLGYLGVTLPPTSCFPNLCGYQDARISGYQGCWDIQVYIYIPGYQECWDIWVPDPGSQDMQQGWQGSPEALWEGTQGPGVGSYVSLRCCLPTPRRAISLSYLHTISAAPQVPQGLSLPPPQDRPPHVLSDPRVQLCWGFLRRTSSGCPLSSWPLFSHSSVYKNSKSRP